MAPENFRAAEDAFFSLRGQLDCGRITPQQFDEKLREQIVQDASGRYWMVGAQSGKWYCYDGSNWVPGDPFSDAIPALSSSPSTPASPTGETGLEFEPASSVPKQPASNGRESRFGLVTPLVGIAFLLLAVFAALGFRYPDGIFVAPGPLFQLTHNLLPTRISRLSTTTSESANIPRVTPFTLDTPVPQPSAPTTSRPAPVTDRLRVGNGPNARMHKLPLKQFILDGALNEWSGESVPLNVAHFGANNWFGPSDLSGTAWLGWNENFLMIAVNVLDDAHVQTQQSGGMFRGDSVELWIDADLEGDFEVATANGDDYQFGFSPGDFADLSPEGVLYIPYRDPIVNQQIFVAAQPNSAGYTLEAAVPWAVLRVQPGPGRVFGYAVDLSDNDVPLTAQQETQVNSNPNFRFQMPATFGNLILE